MIQDSIRRLVEGANLDAQEVAACVAEIAEGKATQAQVGAFLVAFRSKGETPDEISAFAGTLRAYGVRIAPAVRGRLVDTCGTGGDAVKTFNVSTVAALVAAGAGATVAKHGNRSVTSKCGSADLMERLGFNLGTEPSRVKESIERSGIGFMFAPTFHPALKSVASIRREVGVRTVFNLMGPLLNPAGANCQVVGVYSPELVPTVSRVLQQLGSDEAMVVHAVEGMDEISVSGRTLVAWLRRGEVRTMDLAPRDFGVEKHGSSSVTVSEVDEAARMAMAVLEDRGGGAAARDMVLVNAAAALVVAGLAEDFMEGVERARDSIGSGAAKGKLEDVVRSSGGDLSRIEVLARNA